jgi:hypothetical protein
MCVIPPSVQGDEEKHRGQRDHGDEERRELLLLP